ncbi:WH2 domain-containing protein, partial [Wolbachia endosymbiont of Bemisia tabaci]|uniref:WH2 domain-containing protein n=1 Tax=Wolbachia endosymbiont of Bemisia tabaci TaxID=215173 RepID=UPI00272DC4C7
MTGQHNGVQSDSENQKSSVAEQKKATGLKYSIAILLLFTSGAVAGVCTYFIISAVLSSAAVPVSSAVIAFVSASVMLSLAAYLINSHLSAINSEKGVDPGRKQSQDLQEAKGLEHSNSANTPTSSLPVMSGTPSAPPPPPPPPEKSNDLSTTQRVIRKSSPSDANQKDVQQKQFNTSVDARSNLLAEIRKGLTLKKVSDEQK